MWNFDSIAQWTLIYLLVKRSLIHLYLFASFQICPCACFPTVQTLNSQLYSNKMWKQMECSSLLKLEFVIPAIAIREIISLPPRLTLSCCSSRIVAGITANIHFPNSLVTEPTGPGPPTQWGWVSHLWDEALKIDIGLLHVLSPLLLTGWRSQCSSSN